VKVATRIFRVEQMQPEDLEAVLRIETASFTEPWTREMFQAELIPGISLALVAWSEANTILGYLFGSIVAAELHISNIAVEPEARRQGVGSKLLLSALALASRQGATTASLEVRASNLTAQTLYRHFGFTVVGRRRRYYAEPVEDGLIMTLDELDQAVSTRSESEKT
jgi:[ribosomal protein S18]-alanine N-acetyltransferase